MEKEKVVVLDSHVLFWLITNPRKISPLAKTAINNANKVVVPIITLFEIFWLLEKENAKETFPDVLSFLKERRYLVYPVNKGVLQKFIATPKIEMHDRLILATALIFQAILASKDATLRSAYAKTVW